MVAIGQAAAGVLLALAVGAAILVPTAPCLPEASTPSVLRAGLYGAARLVCHRRPDRSLEACGRQWLVCGRCAGLYFGAGLMALGAAIGWRPRLRRSGRAAWWRVVLVGSALPTLGLWVLELARVAAPTTPQRLASAVPLGLAVGAWLTAVARGDLR